MRHLEIRLTQERGLFKETKEGIRAKNLQAFACATTSSSSGNGINGRLPPFRLVGHAKPSFAMPSSGSLISRDAVSVITPKEFLALIWQMNSEAFARN